MKNLKLKKLVAIGLVAMTIATVSPIGASAAWKQNSTGWWNTEGDSWSTGWRNIDSNWYNFGSDGYMKTGWAKDNGTWYYLNPVSDGTKGAMKTGWVKDNGTWYYLNPVSDGTKGAMKTGWIKDNGTWYFAASSGAMQTGVVQVDGKVYYLAESGAMATGTVTINGVVYTFDASGAAIGDKIPTPDKDKAFKGDGSTTDVSDGGTIIHVADGSSHHNSGGSTSGSLSDLSDGATHTGNYTISTGGTFGASKVTTITGDVSIADTNASTSDSITLQNLTISGTLTVDFGAGNVILDNVTVNGVNVSNVGSNSLHVKGRSSIKNLQVNDKNGDAHIVVEGNATIISTILNSAVKFEVASSTASVQTITANTTAPVVISGTGNVNNVIVGIVGANVDLQATSIGTIFVNKNATIIIASGTTVATLNANAIATVTGSGTITTANLGVTGTTMTIRPTNIAVLSGVTLIINGVTLDEHTIGVVIIISIPTGPQTVSDFQNDINSQYADYAKVNITKTKTTGDAVSFTVEFDKTADSKTGGTIDYVTQDVLVTNADGTDEGITYDSATKEYTAETGAKVYPSVRVYRSGQIGYVVAAPKTVE